MFNLEPCDIEKHWNPKTLQLLATGIKDIPIADSQTNFLADALEAMKLCVEKFEVVKPDIMRIMEAEAERKRKADELAAEKAKRAKSKKDAEAKAEAARQLAEDARRAQLEAEEAAAAAAADDEEDEVEEEPEQ